VIYAETIVYFSAVANIRDGFVVSQRRDDAVSALPTGRGSVRLRIRAGRTRTRSVQRREYRVPVSAEKLLMADLSNRSNLSNLANYTFLAPCVSAQVSILCANILPAYLTNQNSKHLTV